MELICGERRRGMNKDKDNNSMSADQMYVDKLQSIVDQMGE